MMKFSPLLALVFLSTTALARTIYLNGVDISSARNQNLKNVDLRIDENGNLYVEAPHYQVNEENTFTPLSSWLQGVHAPKHMPPQEVPKPLNSVGETKAVPTVNEGVLPDSPDTVPLTNQLEKPATTSQLQDKPGAKVGGG